MMRWRAYRTVFVLVSTLVAFPYAGTAASRHSSEVTQQQFSGARDWRDCQPTAQPLILASAGGALHNPDAIEIDVDGADIPLVPLDPLVTLQALGPAWEFYLVIEKVHAQVQPGVILGVYFGLDDAARRDRVFLFDFYLYDAIAPAPPQTYRHNITEQMRRLKALRLPSFRPIVTIRPELSWASSEQFDQLRALQRARPTISRIELVAQCG